MPTSLIEHLSDLIPSSVLANNQGETASELTDWIQHSDDPTVIRTLTELLAFPVENWASNAAQVSSILVGILRRQADQPVRLNQALIDAIGSVYPHLSLSPVTQALLLRILLKSGEASGIGRFAELLVSQPSRLDQRLLLETFGELLRLTDEGAAAVFPLLLEGINQPNMAGLIVDYANFCFREGYVDTHPAFDQQAHLTSLLGRLSERLQTIQDKPPSSDEDAVQFGKQVTESVALCVSLCDALASIGDSSAIGSLNKALNVEHRRLRVEAAAALAKLGVEDARKVLIAMAAEPVERLRVLAYAEELDILDEVEEEFSNIVARAEAEFVMHLTQPTQIGIAPQHIELVDQRELSWPGYEEPRNCFLFHFVYQFGGETPTEHTNLGIAGPVVMTFDCDLTCLSYDDVFAMFAGWHVEHEDILGVAADRVAGQDEIHMHRLLRSITDSDEYSDVEPAVLGILFERRFLVASARRQDQLGWVLVGEDSISWVPLGDPRRPIGANDAFHLFVGRSLLQSFN